MYRSLPDFPPLFPSLSWWRLRFQSLMAGDGIEESVLVANNKSGEKSRDWMRFKISGNAESRITLSMPVAGGGSSLKNHHPLSWQLAPAYLLACRKIDMTVATLLGGLPFGHLLKEELSLSNIIARTGALNASEFCWEADRRVCWCLGLATEPAIECLKADLAERKEVVEPMRKVKASAYSGSASIVETLYGLGREAIFLLI